MKLTFLILLEIKNLGQTFRTYFCLPPTTLIVTVISSPKIGAIFKMTIEIAVAKTPK